MTETMIGVDLAKRVFQLHGATRRHADGACEASQDADAREQFRRFMAGHPPCTVVFEACGRASHRAREMARLGHDARLIAPHYVRPFVTRQKTESADAEAIVIAARQPEMRVKEPKTVEQQSRAAVFRGRERRVHQRTAGVNALRALLHAHGHVFPIGDTPARSHHGARGG